MNRPDITSVSYRQAPDRCVLAKAISHLAAGCLIVIPTDTVYGLAADPRVSNAVKRLYQAKKRSKRKPVALLAANVAQIKKTGVQFGEVEKIFAEKYWPGALTLVLPVQEPAGRKKPEQNITFEAVRIPAHPVARAVADSAGTALRVTSANISGKSPALSAGKAADSLGSKITLILDAGPTPGKGEPSTVVKLWGKYFMIIREGAISAAEIASTSKQIGLYEQIQK